MVWLLEQRTERARVNLFLILPLTLSLTLRPPYGFHLQLLVFKIVPRILYPRYSEVNLKAIL